MTHPILSEWHRNKDLLIRMPQQRAQARDLFKKRDYSPRSGPSVKGSSTRYDLLRTTEPDGPRTAYKNRGHSASTRFTKEELEIVHQKAKQAGYSTCHYIRAAALASTYKPPINEELHKLLLALNKELTMHGHAFTDISKHVKSGDVDSGQVRNMLAAIRIPLVQALSAVKNALVPREPRLDY